MAQGQITYNDKTDNLPPVEPDKQVSAANLNEIKNTVNANATDAESRMTANAGGLAAVARISSTFSSSTTVEDPGNGFFRFNAGNTSLIISYTQNQGSNIKTILEKLGDGSVLKIQASGNKYKIINITGNLSDQTTYGILPISIDNQGTALDNEDVCGLLIIGGAGGEAQLQLQYDSTTIAADPGAGKIRFNNADPSLATEVYVSDTQYDGGNIGELLDSFSGKINLTALGNRAKNGNLLGVTVIDNTGWYTLNFTAGTFGTALDDGDVIGLTLLRGSNFQAVINSISDLDEAISESKSGNYVIVSDITLDADKTLPTNVTLEFRNNAAITFGAFNLVGDKTRIKASPLQIFNYDATGGLSGVWYIESIFPEWFGASNDGTNPTLTANALNHAVALMLNNNNLNTVPIKSEVVISGRYLIDRPIEHFVHNGSVFIASSGKIRGVKEARTTKGTYIEANFNDKPLLIAQKNYDSQFENFTLLGNTGVFFPNITDLIEDNVFPPTGAADGTYNPYCGLAIDPFGAQTGSDQYPDLSQYYGDTDSGSSGIRCNNISVEEVIVAFAISLSSGTQLGEWINLNNCGSFYNKWGIAIGQDQNRSINITNFDLFGGYGGITTKDYGRGTAAQFSVNNMLIHGSTVECFNVDVSWGGNIDIKGVFGEVIYRIGDFTSTNGTIKVSGCFFGLLEYTSLAFNPNQHFPENVIIGGGTLFESCFIGDQTNASSGIPIIVNGGKYNNCVFGGDTFGAEDYFNCELQSGEPIIGTRDNPSTTTSVGSFGGLTFAIARSGGRATIEYTQFVINPLEGGSSYGVATYASFANNNDGTGTISVTSNALVGDWIYSVFRNQIVGEITEINTGVATLRLVPRDLTSLSSGEYGNARMNRYRPITEATVAFGTQITVPDGTYWSVGDWIFIEDVYGTNYYRRIVDITDNVLTPGAGLISNGIKTIMSAYIRTDSNSQKLAAPTFTAVANDKIKKVGDVVTDSFGKRQIGWRYDKVHNSSGSWVAEYEQEELSALATLDFGSIAANSQAELTVTLTGVTEGDNWTVLASPRNGIEAGLIWSVYISAADTVTIRLANITGASIDPASINWKVVATRL